MITTIVDPVTLTAVATVTGAVCGLLRTWLGRRAEARHDAEVTRRLELLIASTPVSGRLAAVRAWGALEGGCRGHGPDGHDPVSATPDGPR